MTEIAILFWTLVFVAGAVALLLGLEVLDDDPTRRADYQPPRSHHDDPFEHTGASFH